MSKFDEYFSDVQHFSDNTLVISGYLSLKAAAKEFSHYTGEDVEEESISKDLVRFGFAPETVVDHGELRACWYTGARKGRGSKPVWVLG